MQKFYQNKKYGKYALVKGFITEGIVEDEDSTTQWTATRIR